MDQHFYFKQCKLAALQAFDEGRTVQVRLDPGRETSLKLLFGLELAGGFRQLDQEANSFAAVASSVISTRFPEMVSDDEAQIIGAVLMSGYL